MPSERAVMLHVSKMAEVKQSVDEALGRKPYVNPIVALSAGVTGTVLAAFCLSIGEFKPLGADTETALLTILAVAIPALVACGVWAYVQHSRETLTQYKSRVQDIIDQLNATSKNRVNGLSDEQLDHFLLDYAVTYETLDDWEWRKALFLGHPNWKELKAHRERKRDPLEEWRRYKATKAQGKHT